MKYLLILSCLLFTSVGWSKDISWDDLIKSNQDGLFYEKFMDTPFSGKVTGEEQGKISKGKRDGKWIKYYENGQFLFEGNYKDGKKEGEQLAYYENGQLRRKSNYKDDKKDGEWIGYYENGQLRIKGNYKDGKLDGEFLMYDEDGKLKRTRIYKDGEIIETITP